MKRGLWPILFLAGLLGVLALTLAAFRLPVGDSIRILAHGAFGDAYGWSRTLVKTSPLLLTALGMVVAWRAGMYNIGGEGQFLIGGLCAATVFKLAPAMPGPVLHILLVLACAAGGAGYAWIAGWLAVHRGVQLVISTILMNFIALYVLDWAVDGPLRRVKGDMPQTDALPQAAMWLRPDPRLDLHSGVLIGMFCAALLWVYIFRTAGGFDLRLTGSNPHVARANRIDANRVRLWAMALSGALCGLAACSEYVGVTGTLDKGFSQQWGFLGIPAALLGGTHPLGAVASSFYFGALFAGSESLARTTPIGPTLVFVIQAVAVLGFVGLKRWMDGRIALEAGT